MEFETNKATTAEDLALADAPRVTLQPVHSDVQAEATASSAIATDASRQSFGFETESTAPAALSAAKLTDHPHHTMAVIIALAMTLLFGAAMTALYLLR